MESIQKITQKLSLYLNIKNVSLASLVLNLVSIVLGIVYFATMTVYNVGRDLLGTFLIITLFANILLAFLNGNRVNLDLKKGKILRLLCYLYLVFIIIAMIGMMLGNLFISVDYAIDIVDNAIVLLSYEMIYMNYFAIVGFGFLLAFYDFRNVNNQELWAPTQSVKTSERRILKYFKFCMKFICYATVIFSIYVCYLLFNGSSDFFSGFIGVLVNSFTLFGAFMAISTIAILLLLKDKSQNPKAYYGIGIIGIIITTIFLMPLFLTPYSAYSAEKNFNQAFGADYNSRRSIEVEQKYFLNHYFSSGEYFLGIPPKECRIMQQVLFYEDEEIELYFDAYLPPKGATNLPGGNSVIIRIHGGGWVWGDKGWGNMMQMNKYFAAQGYVVYDIQYRIHQFDLLEWEPLTPDYRKGDFSMEDILDSLGYFTKFIAANKQDYGNPNLDSVFVSGGSAGGHLTCSLALGIASGKYTSRFGTAITIKGMIPYYPGNGVANYLGIEGAPEILDPSLLVDVNSPPCLIYQGTSDGLVNPRISQTLKDTYTSNGINECAVLWMPMGAHANDVYFNGYYNMIFLYFYERFLYTYR